jgi:purine-cytosine permease-like protein
MMIEMITVVSIITVLVLIFGAKIQKIADRFVSIPQIFVSIPQNLGF